MVADGPERRPEEVRRNLAIVVEGPAAQKRDVMEGELLEDAFYKEETNRGT